MIFPGAPNIRRRSYPGPPEWSRAGAVLVGCGTFGSGSVGVRGGPGRGRSGPDRLVLEVLL